MQRRKFIQNLALLTGSAVFTNFAPTKVTEQKKKTVRGYVLSKGKGIKNVIVSDGYNVVATDKSGRYEFEPNANGVAVFISTPSGYAFKNNKGIARHYRLLKEVNKKKLSISILFRLTLMMMNTSLLFGLTRKPKMQVT